MKSIIRLFESYKGCLFQFYSLKKSENWFRSSLWKLPKLKLIVLAVHSRLGQLPCLWIKSAFNSLFMLLPYKIVVHI